MMETKFRIFDGYKMRYFDLKSDITIKYGHLYLPEEDIYLDLKHSVIMHYIGEKDKNGKEIYEKDLVKNDCGQIGKVVFKHGAFVFQWNDGTETYWNSDPNAENDIEVIGNMFENFDLFNLCLKEANNAEK